MPSEQEVDRVMMEAIKIAKDLIARGLVSDPLPVAVGRIIERWFELGYIEG